MSILLKNGTVIDYKNSIFEQYDVLIENDTIKKLEKNPVMIGSNFLSLTKFISVGAIIGSGIDFLIDKYREKNT